VQTTVTTGSDGSELRYVGKSDQAARSGPNPSSFHVFCISDEGNVVYERLESGVVSGDRGNNVAVSPPPGVADAVGFGVAVGGAVECGVAVACGVAVGEAPGVAPVGLADGASEAPVDG